MANLNNIDKRNLEKLFTMDKGYVLDFTDATFADFFREYSIAINNPKYKKQNSGSKANRLRNFWNEENDVKVGKVLMGLINIAKYLGGRDSELITECEKIVARLTGKSQSQVVSSEQEFLNRDFSKLDFTKLSRDIILANILNLRIEEIKICLKHNAPLSVIFLTGSVLEGVLLELASDNIEKFNKAPSSPKNKGKIKEINTWTLFELITVSAELNYLGKDVKEFSHTLRDFRNYIHPRAQIVQNFNPDEDTAKICFQVMLAAINDITEKK